MDRLLIKNSPKLEVYNSALILPRTTFGLKVLIILLCLRFKLKLCLAQNHRYVHIYRVNNFLVSSINMYIDDLKHESKLVCKK